MLAYTGITFCGDTEVNTGSFVKLNSTPSAMMALSMKTSTGPTPVSFTSNLPDTQVMADSVTLVEEDTCQHTVTNTLC